MTKSNYELEKAFLIKEDGAPVEITGIKFMKESAIPSDKGQLVVQTWDGTSNQTKSNFVIKGKLKIELEGGGQLEVVSFSQLIRGKYE